MRKINKIIIHCAATKPSMDIGVPEIRKWHLERGFSDIGYHDVIRRDGSVEEGRPMELAGAHCQGQNAHSIGICLVGGIDEKGKPENNFTEAQFKSLRRLLSMYKTQHKKATIHGHNEFNYNKACPSFNVQDWLRCNQI